MGDLRTWYAERRSWALWLLIIFTAHALDALTTAIGLRLGIPEANPFMASMLGGGELAMFGFKFIGLAALVLAVTGLRARYPLVWPFFKGISILVVLVVINNAAQIAEAMGILS